MAGFLRNDTAGKVVKIPVDKLQPSPHQPRRVFSSEELRSLAASIKQDGILQPLVVRAQNGSYVLIAGERRLRAAKLAGLTEVPCIVHDADEQAAAVLSLTENIQRENLSFYDEAVAIRNLCDMLDLTQEQVAERIGKSQSAVANKLRLLRLPQEQLGRLVAGGLTERHARALLKIQDDAQREQLIDKILARRLTVEETERLVQAALHEVPKGKKTIAIKDVRLFINTINKAVKALKQQGLNADTAKRETDFFIEYTVYIPKTH